MVDHTVEHRHLGDVHVGRRWRYPNPEAPLSHESSARRSRAVRIALPVRNRVAVGRLAGRRRERRLPYRNSTVNRRVAQNAACRFGVILPSLKIGSWIQSSRFSLPTRGLVHKRLRARPRLRAAVSHVARGTSRSEHMMSEIARNTIADAVGDPRLPRRPSWMFSALLDGGFAVGAYLAAYWLRFYGDRLEAFLPGAWSTMPLVVGMQLAALGAVRAYARRPRVDWLVRVIAGVALGTAARERPHRPVDGLRGHLAQRISRRRHAAVDRGHRLARRVGSQGTSESTRCRALAPGSELVDRSAEMTTLTRGRAEPLQVSRAAQEPRPQRYQAEVPRLGVRLSVVAGQSRC